MKIVVGSQLESKHAGQLWVAVGDTKRISSTATSPLKPLPLTPLNRTATAFPEYEENEIEDD
jgi:hypothetical protein